MAFQVEEVEEKSLARRMPARQKNETMQSALLLLDVGHFACAQVAKLVWVEFDEGSNHVAAGRLECPKLGGTTCEMKTKRRRPAALSSLSLFRPH